MIEPAEITELMEAVAEVIRQRDTKLAVRFEELIAQIQAIPAGPQGERGPEGRVGDAGPAGPQGPPGEPGEKGETGERGAAGPEGPEGPAGKDGESLQGPQGIPGEKGERGEKGDPGELGPMGLQGAAGKDGQSGKDGEDGRHGIDGKDGQPGKDGRDGIDGKAGETGKDGDNGRDGRDGRDGKDGRDGSPGRDALEIEILDGIDPEKTYPPGTWAVHQNGLVRFDATGKLRVIINGWSAPEFQQGDDPRSITIRQRSTSGQASEVCFHIPFLLYRGVFKTDSIYTRGDCVTHVGSMWVCMSDQTSAVPGMANSDWVLSAKRGNAGRDGKDGRDGDRGPQGPRGMDLTQLGFDGSKH